jgi:hypothetical protein
MKIPSSEQLSAAVEAAKADDKGHDELRKAMSESNPVLMLYIAVTAGSLGIKPPQMEGNSRETVAKKLSEVLKSIDPNVRQAIKDAMIWGAQIGLNAAEGKTTPLTLAPKDISEEILTLATAKFAVDTVLDRAKDVLDTYHELAKGDIFLRLLILAYNLARKSADVVDTDVANLDQTAVDAMTADGDMTRRLGMCMALGLMVGRLLPSAAAASKAMEDAKPAEKEEPVDGGWR